MDSAIRLRTQPHKQVRLSVSDSEIPCSHSFGRQSRKNSQGPKWRPIKTSDNRSSPEMIRVHPRRDHGDVYGTTGGTDAEVSGAMGDAILMCAVAS